MSVSQTPACPRGVHDSSFSPCSSVLPFVSSNGQKLPHLFADENIRPAFAGLLRFAGFEVETPWDASLVGNPDRNVIAHAVRTGRVIVTHDRELAISKHFRYEGSRGAVLLPSRIEAQEPYVFLVLKHIADHLAAKMAKVMMDRPGVLVQYELNGFCHVVGADNKREIARPQYCKAIKTLLAGTISPVPRSRPFRETSLFSLRKKKPVLLAADENLGPAFIKPFKAMGFDIISIKEWGLARAADSHIIEEAARNERIVITQDRKFARFAPCHGKPATGIIIVPVKANSRQEGADALRQEIGAHLAFMLAKNLARWSGTTVQYNNDRTVRITRRFRDPAKPKEVFLFPFAVPRSF